MFGKGAGNSLYISTCLWFQLTREFFTKELKKHYQRNNDTDVFSSTWNSVMITVSQTASAPSCPWSVAINTAHTLSSPRVSLLQPSCHIQPSTRAFGWREVRLWLAVFLKWAATSPEIETLLVTALSNLRHWSTLSFQILGTECSGGVCNWVSLHLLQAFHLAESFKIIPSQ